MRPVNLPMPRTPRRTVTPSTNRLRPTGLPASRSSAPVMASQTWKDLGGWMNAMEKQRREANRVLQARLKGEAAAADKEEKKKQKAADRMENRRRWEADRAENRRRWEAKQEMSRSEFTERVQREVNKTLNKTLNKTTKTTKTLEIDATTKTTDAKDNWRSTIDEAPAYENIKLIEKRYKKWTEFLPRPYGGGFTMALIGGARMGKTTALSGFLTAYLANDKNGNWYFDDAVVYQGRKESGLRQMLDKSMKYKMRRLDLSTYTQRHVDIIEEDMKNHYENMGKSKSGYATLMIFDDLMDSINRAANSTKLNNIYSELVNFRKGEGISTIFIGQEYRKLRSIKSGVQYYALFKGVGSREIGEIARDMGIDADDLRKEFNSMPKLSFILVQQGGFTPFLAEKWSDGTFRYFRKRNSNGIYEDLILSNVYPEFQQSFRSRQKRMQTAMQSAIQSKSTAMSGPAGDSKTATESRTAASGSVGESKTASARPTRNKQRVLIGFEEFVEALKKYNVLKTHSGTYPYRLRLGDQCKDMDRSVMRDFYQAVMDIIKTKSRNVAWSDHLRTIVRTQDLRVDIQGMLDCVVQPIPLMDQYQSHECPSSHPFYCTSDRKCHVRKDARGCSDVEGKTLNLNEDSPN